MTSPALLERYVDSVGFTLMSPLKGFQPSLLAPDVLSFIRAAQARLSDREQELERNYRLLDTYLIHIPLVTFIKDEQFRYVYVNPRCYALFANLVISHHAEWTGHTDEEIFGEERQARVRPHDTYVLQTGCPIERTETLPSVEGTPTEWRVCKFRFETETRLYVGGIAFALDASGRPVLNPPAIPALPLLPGTPASPESTP